MERLTSNKPVDEMSMVELAHNSCYAENQKAMYRDFEMNMDARDFARNLMVTLTEDELSIDDDTFDEEILENLQYDPFSDIRGLIALFYRNLWAMADLRERLAAYEDTNLIPERIVEVDKLYLEKCQEVNRLNAELAELKKQPQGDLISRSALIEHLLQYNSICGIPLTEKDKKIINGVIGHIGSIEPTAFDVDAVVEQIKNINTTWNCQKCEYSKICDDIEKCGDEHLDLCAEVVKRVSINIVRNGGKG